jgi:hypothetical protein
LLELQLLALLVLELILVRGSRRASAVAQHLLRLNPLLAHQALLLQRSR